MKLACFWAEGDLSERYRRTLAYYAIFERMCGRYALAGDWADFVSTFQLTALRSEAGAVIGADGMQLSPRYNIAPSAAGGFEVPVITARGLQAARFWYIPSWWKRELNRLPTAFNAKSEELSEKPFFRGAEKVLVPLSGWREFPGRAGEKKSFAFERGAASAGNGRFFAVGAIGCSFLDPVTNEPGYSVSLLTTSASVWMQPYHHRMPLLVPTADYAAWQDPKIHLQELLPAATQETHHAHEVGQVGQLSAYECSTIGNSTREQGPECVWPIDKALADARLQPRLHPTKKSMKSTSQSAASNASAESMKQQSLFGDS